MYQLLVIHINLVMFVFFPGLDCVTLGFLIATGIS